MAGLSPEPTREELDAVSMSVRPKFIPRGYEKLDKSVYNAIFYSTATTDAFRNPATHASNGKALHAGARGKSVQDIHDASRVGKWYSKAPLYQRSMCAYTQQFVPRPLDGVQINKECYNLFKEKCETAGTSSGGKHAQFRSETETGKQFQQYEAKEARNAIPPNFKPKVQVHVSRENKLLVTQSAQHQQFPCPSPEHTKNARPANFKPKPKRHMSVGSLSGCTSSYSRDYDPSKYDAVWPVKFAHQAEHPPATSGYTGLVALHPEDARKLKPEEFKIGDVLTMGPC